MNVETHEGADSLAPDWEELADRTQAAPWLRPGWISAWWSAFGRGRLAILALRRDGRLVGLLPLVRRRGALLSPTNWHTPAFGPLAEDEEAERSLAEIALADPPRRLSLGFLPPGTALGALQAEAARKECRVLARTLQRSPYVALDGDWEGYLDRLDGKFLRELRRRRRRLDERGGLELDVVTEPERVDAALEESFAVELASWKGSAGTAIGSRPETRRFYSDVARWAAARGSLRLGFLRAGGAPVAFQLGVEDGGAYYLLKTGYDPAFHEHGPGVLIVYEMLARAFESGLASYEFLGSDAPWKRAWTDSTRPLLLFQAFAPTLAGAVDWAAFAYGRPLAKRALAAAGRT